MTTEGFIKYSGGWSIISVFRETLNNDVFWKSFIYTPVIQKRK